MVDVGGPAKPRVGAVAKAIVKVLTETAGPMRAGEVHRAVEQRLGEPVRRRSVTSYLSKGSAAPNARFRRVGRGRYELISRE